MHLSTNATPAHPTSTPVTTGHGWGNHVVRRGGPDAAPAADVVAQAAVQLPANFGVHVLLDVSMGERLGAFASTEDAVRAVRELHAAGERRNVGIVHEARGDDVVVTAVELLLPDIGSLPGSDFDWGVVTSSPIRFGRDAARAHRFVEGLVAVDQGDRWITGVVLDGGGMFEFEHDGDGTRRTRFNQDFG